MVVAGYECRPEPRLAAQAFEGQGLRAHDSQSCKCIYVNEDMLIDR